MKFMLPDSIIKIIEDAPVSYSPDAPQLTKEQLAKFNHRSPERLARFGIYPTNKKDYGPMEHEIIHLEYVDGKIVIPTEIQKIIEEAAKHPVNYTQNSPKLTKKQLSRFVRSADCVRLTHLEQEKELSDGK